MAPRRPLASCRAFCGGRPGAGRLLLLLLLRLILFFFFFLSHRSGLDMWVRGWRPGPGGGGVGEGGGLGAAAKAAGGGAGGGLRRRRTRGQEAERAQGEETMGVDGRGARGARAQGLVQPLQFDLVEGIHLLQLGQQLVHVLESLGAPIGLLINTT